MTGSITSTLEHYERLIHEDNDPFRDPIPVREYMSRWDGPLFLSAVGSVSGKEILEVGVGTGRLASTFLEGGCARLVGIDISPKTIARARQNLAGFRNCELVVTDILSFVRPEAFDIVYSVLTLMHVDDKHSALQNMVASLKPGGHVALSISEETEWLDCGRWMVRLYPAPPEVYAACLADLGCKVDEPTPLIDLWVGPNGTRDPTYGTLIAALVKGTKV